MKNRFLVIFVLFPAFIFSGCSFKKIALRSTIDLIGKGTEAFYEEPDAKLAEESLASQIKLLEILLKNDPQNYELNLYACQGFGAYAFLFLEGSDKERAKNFYERGRNFGLTILNNACSLNILEEPDAHKVENALQKLGTKDVPMLFWTAYSWGGLANLSRDNPESIASLPKIERMMLRVNELLPGYFYSGADIFLGSYYGSRPKMFGGDLEKSKFYFERSIAVSNGKFLLAPTLFAEYYAVPAGDKGLYKNLLEKVLSFPAREFPEQRLSNDIAKIRAKKLLEEIDEKF